MLSVELMLIFCMSIFQWCFIMSFLLVTTYYWKRQRWTLLKSKKYFAAKK